MQAGNIKCQKGTYVWAFFTIQKGFYILKNNKWLQTKFEKKNLEG